MAAKSENKSIELLLNQFHELSNNTKELDTTVSNFSQIASDFKTTLEILDQTNSFKELGLLSKDALSRMKELKSLNEYQVLDKLEEMIQKGLSNQNQKLETHLKKIFAQTQEISRTNKQPDNEMMAIIQQINSKLDRTQMAAAPTVMNEEMAKLKRYVSSMSAKIKRMEENYEERISMLEMEIELLRETQSEKVSKGRSVPIDISDDDLPF